MTDQGNQLSDQQTSQSATVPEGTQVQGQALSPELIATIESVMEKSLRNFTREQQSQRDKLEARISKRLDAQADAVKSVTGQDLTPEQRNQLRNHVRGQVEAEFLEEAQHTQRNETTPQVQPAKAEPKHEEVSPVEKFIVRMMEKAGVTIEDSDPEAALLADVSPDDLYDKVSEAIEQKKARIQADPQAAALAAQQAAGRVSSSVTQGAPGNPIASITDPDALWELSKKQRK